MSDTAEKSRVSSPFIVLRLFECMVREVSYVQRCFHWHLTLCTERGSGGAVTKFKLCSAQSKPTATRLPIRHAFIFSV